jgi:serine/threonine protein kinase
LLNRLTSTGPLQIKLIDFEFAARLSALRKTQLGTLASLSPEVANETFQDEKIDVWGVGVILFNLLTKTQPFLVKG